METDTPNFITAIRILINEMIEIQSMIYSIINEKDSIDSLLKQLQHRHILEDKNKFHDFLKFLNSISSTKIITKEINIINSIIISLKAPILENFTRNEIFLNFKYNMPILLCLYENDIIGFEQLSKYSGYELYRFFLPEFIEHEGCKNIDYFIKDLAEPYKNNLDQFRKDRKEYHSDVTIAKLIRSDDVEGFISYVMKTNIPLDSEIKDSLYETKSDLRHMCKSLIEYAASFGSIGVFKYLYCNLATLPSNVLLGAVFGGNFEIIHLLEKKDIKPDNFILFRSILAHRNELFDYFISNYSIELNFELIDDSLRVFNYYCFNQLLAKNPEFLSNINYISSIFSNTCCYDNRTLFNILYKIPDLDVNFEKEIFFFYFDNFNEVLFFFFF